MNYVIEAIDAGHYMTAVEGKGEICRADVDPWPCALILHARKHQRIDDEVARQARSQR